jgi:glycosyltransferase involved in cell wall biosynthesis
MHVLWLASWYPHEGDPFNGDFIQRHARALATRQPVTVLHVAKSEGNTYIDVRCQGQLTERIGYARAARTRLAWWNAMASGWRSFVLYRKALHAHIAEQGRPDLIHVHVCMNAGMMALWIKAFYGIPFVVTEHYSSYIPGSPGNVRSRSALYRLVNRVILEQALGVHSVSKFLLDCIGSFAVIRGPLVIPNVVDTGLFRLSDVGEGTRFSFIHVSTFLPYKNVQGILDAFVLLSATHADWDLVLVGPAGEDIRRYAAEKAFSGRLIWTGEKTYAEVAGLVRQAQAMVHFSRLENQPCVISEALCCGCAVVASAVGGIPEVITEENGLLVPSGDVPALAMALADIMAPATARDPARIAREAGARHGYEPVSKEFSLYYTTFKEKLRKTT